MSGRQLRRRTGASAVRRGALRRRGGRRGGRGYRGGPLIRRCDPGPATSISAGYDCELVEKPPTAFQHNCPVCLLVLREPQQVTCCGYNFCAPCIKRVQEEENCCPTCKEADFTAFPDKRLKRSLYECRVYCPLQTAGCEWKGELKEVDKHLNLQPQPDTLLTGCQFSVIECNYCVQTFQRYYIEAHRSEECPKRPYTCQHCKQHDATYEEITQNHWPVCPFFPLSCPNKCELVLQRQEVERHINCDCLLTQVECCGIQLAQKDLPSHISQNLVKHICMQQRMLVQLQYDNQQLREALTTCENKIKAQEAIIRGHRETLESVTCTGTLPFEFTLTDFEQHKRLGDEWYSTPFYTHTRGYRMCIRVDANGQDSNEGEHLSVYCYLMRGDFDDDLQWPFQGTITIQLINQLEDSNHQTHTLNFTMSMSSNTISRVTYGERAECGTSQQKFISHTQLNHNTDRNCQFLKDNRLKFRVSKATNLNPTARIYRRCLTLESFAGAIESRVLVVPIEFTLSDFEQLKKRNEVWHSPPFYTHYRRYRMHLEVFPHGFRNGLGYMSLYTCILQGPFDGSLRWPFRGGVTVQIVNQAAEYNHYEMVIPYNDETPDTYAGRKTDQARSNSNRWGFHEFLPHSSLDYNVTTNTQYLRGDCLRIRISKVELNN